MQSLGKLCLSHGMTNDRTVIQLTSLYYSIMYRSARAGRFYDEQKMVFRHKFMTESDNLRKKTNKPQSYPPFSRNREVELFRMKISKR